MNVTTPVFEPSLRRQPARARQGVALERPCHHRQHPREHFWTTGGTVRLNWTDLKDAMLTSLRSQIAATLPRRLYG